jgi:serine/threonine protein kinase/tetratricopeptide (TPR) repeat protein
VALDHARAKSIFLTASELADSTERAAYVDRECDSDQELRARVAALLRVHDASKQRNPEPLETATQAKDEGARTQVPSDTTAFVGALIAGKYKLVEELGEGGMGHVYMAQQTEPIRRAVAVKVIKSGMDSKSVLARFEAERQALAMMDHPNIARVLDAGVTDSGRPFFVMELIKGVPITSFCDDRKFTLRQRLELFVPVCQAIQHAHQKGIIHRDIKPSNVLVALYDDRPVPKVIDFGIAKAVGQPLTDRTLITSFGAVVGTPEYMSPEQAGFNQEDVDTRSDVYALGVLLYELLTGSTPLDRKSLGKAALLEVLRIVREEEVPRPSDKLSTLDTLPNIAARRGIEPAKLSKMLRGELDWVLLKALEKERTRRYDTVNGLTRDIQRYLADEVVEARPPSVGYRFNKFVRRHKGQVIAAGLVLFALLVGMAVATWGLIEARQHAEDKELARKAEEKQRILAEEKRREAETNLAFAIKGNEILGSVFEALDPQKKYDTIGELRTALGNNLKQAVKELEGSAIGDPLTVAQLQYTLGGSLYGLWDLPSAIAVLEKAYATRKSLLGPEHPQTLSTAAILGECYRSAGKIDLALSLLDETVTLMKSLHGVEHVALLMTMNHLAYAHQDAGKPTVAVSILEEVVDIARAKYGPNHHDTLMFMNNLANLYESNKQSNKALVLYEEALQTTKSVNGPAHPGTWAIMNNLASAYLKTGNVDKALPLLEESYRGMKDTVGQTHPDTAACLGNLGQAYLVKRKFEMAQTLFKEALKSFRAKLAPDHHHVLSCMQYLGNAYREEGKPELALPLYEEVLRLTKTKFGPHHPDTLGAMNNLAAIYWSLKQLDKSVPLLEETLRLKVEKFGRADPATQMTIANLGVNYVDAERVVEGIQLLEEAYRNSKSIPQLSQFADSLESAYVKAGNKAKLIELRMDMLGDARKQVPADSAELAIQLVTNGMSFLQRKYFMEAEPLLREGLALREKLEPDAWTTFNTQSMLGGALLGLKKYAHAEPLLLKGYEGMKQREAKMPKNSPRIPEAIDRLMELYTATDRPAEAAKWKAERQKYPETAAPPKPEKK